MSLELDIPRFFRDLGPNSGAGSIVQGIGGSAPRISTKDLDKLPQFDYKSWSEKEKASHLPVVVDCAVRLESCRLLPNRKCTHSFHSHRINLCPPKTPICRAAINAPPSCRALEEAGQDRASQEMFMSN
ncbi:uncharacterized protein LOC116188896 [Punica granatum]|uniref:Uncharacterized protein LOC116188896 n=2 Tax=Punica granatum TaxID=22663 RepID=A0A6P8BV96_PUNGR|nr:uncharacterized protein LOC116188896 [Punica granatum]PKI77971.1 hypothetical protein CRG98_001591 [Punica granatum]